MNNPEQDVEVFQENELGNSSVKVNTSRGKRSEITIGTIVSVDAVGQPVVTFEGAIGSTKCLTTCDITDSDVGRQVALMFVNGEQSQPIMLGLIRSQLDRIIELYQQSADNNQNSLAIKHVALEEHSEPEEDTEKDLLIVDGKKIRIEGQEEIVLKCGDSSITLTENGKIIIRGKYLLNRSSGVNRIMGGSVQLN